MHPFNPQGMHERTKG